MSSSRNPFVPENFFLLYGYRLKQELSYKNRKPRREEIILSQIIQDSGMKKFNNTKYTRLMYDLSTIQDNSDSDVETFIYELEEWGKKDLAIDFRRRLRARQKLGENWREMFHDYQIKEAKLYVLWCERMLSMGLEHGLINLELLARNKGELK